MRPALAAAVATAVVTAVCGAVSAATPKLLTLRLGDEFALAGTHVVCTTDSGRVRVHEPQRAGARLLRGRNRPNGAAKVVLRRPAVAHAPKHYLVHVGTPILLAGTHLGCVTTTSAQTGGTVACFLIAQNHARPLSYGVTLSDHAGVVVRFDFAGVHSAVVKAARHGS